MKKEEPKMNKIQKEIFEMEQELGVPSHLRWHNTKPNQECDGDVLTCLNEKCVCKHNKIMGQETVEEAAERFYPPKTTDLICSPKLVRDAFEAGAKFQQEQNGLTPNDLIEFSKWVNKMGYGHRLTIIPNDLIDFYLKNKENIIKLNLE
jgi:hypothetical protein